MSIFFFYWEEIHGFFFIKWRFFFHFKARTRTNTEDFKQTIISVEGTGEVWMNERWLSLVPVGMFFKPVDVGVGFKCFWCDFKCFECFHQLSECLWRLRRSWSAFYANFCFRRMLNGFCLSLMAEVYGLMNWSCFLRIFKEILQQWKLQFSLPKF